MHEFRKKPSKEHRDFACRSCNIIVYKNWSSMTGIFSLSINSVNLAKMGLEG